MLAEHFNAFVPICNEPVDGRFDIEHLTAKKYQLQVVGEIRAIRRRFADVCALR